MEKENIRPAEEKKKEKEKEENIWRRKVLGQWKKKRKNWHATGGNQRLYEGLADLKMCSA